MEQHNESEIPSYWPSVGVAGLLFGVIFFIVATGGAYMTIGSEPVGSFFSTQTVGYCLACLLGAFAGMTAIWHYNRETGMKLTLGKGALIGFYSGALIGVIGTLLSQIWYIIDPAFTEELMNWTIANFEAMDQMPDEQRQAMIDSTYSQFQNMHSLWNIVQGLLMYSIGMGILNSLSGLLGVMFFARKKEDI
ncbi:MAG: DUF4199 domain-containing protein [Balneolaceae bacterium]|nr:DUF4199 domain-containing protein [Balneolaceae bacterium]